MCVCVARELDGQCEAGQTQRKGGHVCVCVCVLVHSDMPNKSEGGRGRSKAGCRGVETNKNKPEA